MVRENFAADKEHFSMKVRSECTEKKEVGTAKIEMYREAMPTESGMEKYLTFLYGKTMINLKNIQILLKRLL